MVQPGVSNQAYVGMTLNILMLSYCLCAIDRVEVDSGQYSSGLQAMEARIVIIVTVMATRTVCIRCRSAVLQRVETFRGILRPVLQHWLRPTVADREEIDKLYALLLYFRSLYYGQ